MDPVNQGKYRHEWIIYMGTIMAQKMAQKRATSCLAMFQVLKLRAKVLPEFGFKAQGIALSYEQLTLLEIPAVAYVRPESEDHFTVIRGVSRDHVWIGDPSWGNRRLSRDQFLNMWQTRDDEILKGRLLIVQPINGTPLKSGSFGEPNPHTLPVALQTQRAL